LLESRTGRCDLALPPEGDTPLHLQSAFTAHILSLLCQVLQGLVHDLERVLGIQTCGNGCNRTNHVHKEDGDQLALLERVDLHFQLGDLALQGSNGGIDDRITERGALRLQSLDGVFQGADLLGIGVWHAVSCFRRGA
jgi:hypothetical protein